RVDRIILVDQRVVHRDDADRARAAGEADRRQPARERVEREVVVPLELGGHARGDAPLGLDERALSLLREEARENSTNHAHSSAGPNPALSKWPRVVRRQRGGPRPRAGAYRSAQAGVGDAEVPRPTVDGQARVSLVL